MPLFAGEAYGGMRGPADPFAVPNITATWRVLSGYTENMLPNVGTIFDLVTGQIIFLSTGVFMINMYNSFQHNNSGQSREVVLRFRNTVTGAVSRDIAITTGATARTTTLMGSFLTNIGRSQVGQAYVMEISAPLGDYTSVVVYGASVSAARIAYVPLGP
jgi:hypothetical protein